MRAWRIFVGAVAFAAFSLATVVASSRADDLFANNLGIYYEKVAYDDGTFGAKLTRAPEANSPAAQIGLEVGDVVFMMDDQRFRTPQDVLSHVNNTSVTLIDVRTGQVEQAVVVLPGAAPVPIRWARSRRVREISSPTTWGSITRRSRMATARSERS